VANYAQWRNEDGWQKLLEAGKQQYFVEMGKFAKPDAHLYQVSSVLDKTEVPK
jgi:hypothetical protein